MTDHMQQPIMSVARTDVATLHEGFTVQQALDDIRSRGLGERIVYFYVVDGEGGLVGVVPTRRLLIAPLEERLSEVMIRRVVTIPEEATVLHALRLDPKIAAGPITLALADVCTIVIYFTLATALLR